MKTNNNFTTTCLGSGKRHKYSAPELFSIFMETEQGFAGSDTYPGGTAEPLEADTEQDFEAYF